MDASTPPPLKKSLGPLAWIGIGCGGLVFLVIIAIVTGGWLYRGKFQQFAEDAQKNPARATATTMVAASFGQMEMAAEDDANKRYTVREKTSGKLTTIYWSEAQKKPLVVQGDFSAIPADAGAGSEPPPAPQPK